MTVKLEVFTSHSCPYCPMAVEVAEQMVKKFGDDLDYQHLDVDENMEKVREYEIMSVMNCLSENWKQCMCMLQLKRKKIFLTF